MRVFFGTNRACRKGQDSRSVIFTGNRNNAGTIKAELTLGRAIITVPAFKRQKGRLTQSGFFRKNLGRFFGIDPDGDPDKHFVIYKKGFRLFLAKQDFLDEVKDHINEAGRYKDHAFVFVHYNRPEASGGVPRRLASAFVLLPLDARLENTSNWNCCVFRICSRDPIAVRCISDPRDHSQGGHS